MIVYLEDGITKVGSGYLEGSFIKLEINVKIGDEGAKLAKGSEVFDNIFNEIVKNSQGNSQIKGISGTWYDALGDNLNTFNNLIKEKVNKGILTESEAALNTFTGKMAIKKGFSRVESIAGVKDIDGTYKYITSIKFVK